MEGPGRWAFTNEVATVAKGHVLIGAHVKEFVIRRTIIGGEGPVKVTVTKTLPTGGEERKSYTFRWK